MARCTRWNRVFCRGVCMCVCVWCVGGGGRGRDSHGATGGVRSLLLAQDASTVVRGAQNFALNVAEHGFTIAVNNRSPDKVDTTVKRAQEELGDKVGNLKGCVHDAASISVVRTRTGTLFSIQRRFRSRPVPPRRLPGTRTQRSSSQPWPSRARSCSS
eukprot:COSAG02_NODE_1602_length_11741_cov_35.408521_4_plen_158_part_00